MPREIQYLTVQDHLWINLQVTKRKNRWNFATLEEATFYQYAYGRSTDVPAQAARYAAGFAKKQPFDSGNEATGFVGLVSFLRMNGYHLKWDDTNALERYSSLLGSGDANAELQKYLRLDEHAHDVVLEEVGKAVLEEFPNTIAALMKSPVSA